MKSEAFLYYHFMKFTIIEMDVSGMDDHRQLTEVHTSLYKLVTGDRIRASNVQGTSNAMKGISGSSFRLLIGLRPECRVNVHADA